MAGIATAGSDGKSCGGQVSCSGEPRSASNVLPGPIQLTEIEGGLEEELTLLCFDVILKGAADGVEQKMGFLVQGPRLCSAESLREMSRSGIVTKLWSTAALTELSELDSRKT